MPDGPSIVDPWAGFQILLTTYCIEAAVAFVLFSIVSSMVGVRSSFLGALVIATVPLAVAFVFSVVLHFVIQVPAPMIPLILGGLVFVVVGQTRIVGAELWPDCFLLTMVVYLPATLSVLFFAGRIYEYFGVT
jgi:hypothetical protein